MPTHTASSAPAGRGVPGDVTAPLQGDIVYERAGEPAGDYLARLADEAVRALSTVLHAGAAGDAAHGDSALGVAAAHPFQAARADGAVIAQSPGASSPFLSPETLARLPDSLTQFSRLTPHAPPTHAALLDATTAHARAPQAAPSAAATAARSGISPASLPVSAQQPAATGPILVGPRTQPAPSAIPQVPAASAADPLRLLSPLALLPANVSLPTGQTAAAEATAPAPPLGATSLRTLDPLNLLPAGLQAALAPRESVAAAASASSGLSQAVSGPVGSSFYFVDDQSRAQSGQQLHHAQHAQHARHAQLEQHAPAAGQTAAHRLAVNSAAVSSYDVHGIRRDFPILHQRINGRPLVWLDNAATTHKPQAVIDRLAHFYSHENSNIHRAAHALAARATDAYEGARSTVARFMNAAPEEIVFVRGCTEAINFVAQSWGRAHLRAGDEIIVSHLEHHANIVPWQQLCETVGTKLRVIPVDDSGQIVFEGYLRLLNERTRLVAVTQVSNALGTVVPVEPIIHAAHAAGALALVDGAQSVAHMRVDVRALDADFFVFSGHKLFGPTGIGVVYGKRAVLEATPPWQGGGNMIADVTFERTVYQGVPARFEAGTGNIADAVGLATALDYVERVGLERIAQYEHALHDYLVARLAEVPGIRLIGTALGRVGVQSFTLRGFSPEEVGAALNREGIAVRAGHHCAQPILRRFGVEATVRPSLALYNTCEEVDALAAALQRLVAGR